MEERFALNGGAYTPDFDRAIAMLQAALAHSATTLHRKQSVAITLIGCLPPASSRAGPGSRVG
jgi:hypothetical protein